MKIARCVLAVSCLFIPFVSGGAVSAHAEPAVTTIAQGLRTPWAIAFLPGGDALVSERDTARLLRVTPAGRVSAVAVIPGVVRRPQGGLLGLAVSPHFAQDRFVHAYVSTAQDNRIIRFRYADDTITDIRTILAGIPVADDANGGRLRFGPDGMLYATTGFNFRTEYPQDLDSLGGKILRLTPDGRPAPGNPFPDSVVWTLGHRNVQGIAWDPAGRAFATEFGSATYDELNEIRPGHNYGWPEVEGPSIGSRFTAPEIVWRTGQASPSGITYAVGSLWIAALGGERLWQVPLDRAGQVGTPVEHLVGVYGRLRDVAVAPDGALWMLTSNTDGVSAARPGDDRILVLPAQQTATLGS